MLFLCHNLRLHKLKNRGIAYVKRSSFCFMCSIFNAIFANQDPLPTLRPGNFDLHTKMPGIRPCLSRSIQMSSLCRFTSRRQAEWTRAVARTLIGGGGCIFIYSGSARLVSFEIKLISKEISRAEPEYMNIHPPPPISVLATALEWTPLQASC